MRDSYDKAKDGPQADALVYHNLLGDVHRGATARDVILSLYQRASQNKPEFSYQSWLDYQKNVVRLTMRVDLPDPSTEECAQKFLKILVDNKFLSKGEPPSAPIQHPVNPYL